MLGVRRAVQPAASPNIEAPSFATRGKPLTDRDPPSEELPANAVEQLKQSLKSCRKVVSNYRSALLSKPAGDADPPRGD